MQVTVMQQELTDLQPQLLKTSEETERLMEKIEHDTVEVEAKKEVRYFALMLFLCCAQEHDLAPACLSIRLSHAGITSKLRSIFIIALPRDYTFSG